jgi:hypothetical protein
MFIRLTPFLIALRATVGSVADFAGSSENCNLMCCQNYQVDVSNRVADRHC